MIEIYKAKPEDALGIAIVNVYTWKTQYSGLIDEETIDLRIKNIEQREISVKNRIAEDGQYFVAKKDNTVIGFCRYCKSEKYPGYGEISALYILEGFKGKGIGRSLFEAAKNELVNMGYKQMIVGCLKGNPSLEFYKHMGGKVIEQKEFIVSGVLTEEDILLYNI